MRFPLVPVVIFCLLCVNFAPSADGLKFSAYRWHEILKKRLQSRRQHEGLQPLHHVRQGLNEEELHDHLGDEDRLDNRGKETQFDLDVCDSDDDGNPCKCTFDDGEIDCKNEVLRSTNIKPVFDSKKDEEKKMTVKMVNFRKNALTGLWKDTIVPGHESTLQSLDFSHNAIFFIQDGAFDKMTDLRTLNLGYNRLRRLKKELFNGSGLQWKLHTLIIEDNGLRLIDDGAFSSLTQLEELVLDDNFGLKLTDGAFKGLSSLKTLSLENCNISHLPTDVFKPLAKLENLFLNGNPLTVVPKAVKSLPSLRTLDISETQISEFAEGSLAGDHKLTRLWAQNMRYVWAIENCAFCQLPALQEVSFFNSTQLYLVHENAFGRTTQARNYPTNLTMVDFENCNISTLPEHGYPWHKVETIKLGANPFHCDCQLKWMTNTMLDLSGSKNIPSCATPAHLKGRPLNVLRAYELCDTPFRLGRLFIGLALVLLISIAALIAYCLCTDRMSRPGADGRPKLRISNIFYKPPLPHYAYSNLVGREDERSLTQENEYGEHTGGFVDHFDDPYRADKAQQQPAPAEV